MKFDKRPPTHIINKMIWMNETAFNHFDALGWMTPATKEDVDNIFYGTKVCEHPVTKELYRVRTIKEKLNEKV